MKPDNREYQISDSTTELIGFPFYLYWCEFIMLAAILLIGIALYRRSRQPRHFLLILAAACMSASTLSWVLPSIPAIQTVHAISMLASIVFNWQGWLRCIGALFLAAYIFAQLLRTPRTRGR